MLLRRSLATLSAQARHPQKHLSTTLHRSLSLSVSPAFNRLSPFPLPNSPSSTKSINRSLATMAEQGQAKIIDGNATAAYVSSLSLSLSLNLAPLTHHRFTISSLAKTVLSVKVSHNASVTLDRNSRVSNLTSPLFSKALVQIPRLISK